MPEALNTGNTKTYLALVSILNFATESYVRDPYLFWTKMDAATCARDVYHGEHRGVAWTDFHLNFNVGSYVCSLLFRRRLRNCMRPAAPDSPTPLLIVSGWAGGDTGSVKNSNN